MSRFARERLALSKLAPRGRVRSTRRVDREWPEVAGGEGATSGTGRQEAHHQRNSFVDELKRLLEKNGVSYDPKYLA